MGLAPEEKEIVAWVSLGSGGIETGRRYSFMPVVIDRMVGFTWRVVGILVPWKRPIPRSLIWRALKAGKHRPDISGSVLRNYRAANTGWIPLIKCVVSRALDQRSARRQILSLFAADSGSFELPEIEPGKYAITASSAGYL